MTLIHWGVHDNSEVRELLVQGGWRAKDEAMPLKYARKLGTLSLKFARRILKKVRDGWVSPEVVVFTDKDIDSLPPHAHIIDTYDASLVRAVIGQSLDDASLIAEPAAGLATLQDRFSGLDT